MPLIPFGEYRPDISDYEGQNSLTIFNVLPRADGYGPLKGSVAFSSALPASAPCRGAFAGYNSNGTVTIFGATATNLYTMDNSARTWTLRSKGGVAYSPLSQHDQWQFTQFGDIVLATQANAPLQKYN